MLIVFCRRMSEIIVRIINGVDNFDLKTQKSLDGECSTETFDFYSDKAIVCL